MTFGLHVPGYVRRKLAAGRYEVAVEDLNKVPVFLKIAPDLSDGEIAEIAAVAMETGVAGVIVDPVCADIAFDLPIDRDS